MHADQIFELFCSNLQTRLSGQLPGYEAQKLMEPPTRKHLLSLTHPEPAREGAVLIALFPHQGSISTIMIQRVVYDGVHSGQIAFPGGRRDPEDESLVKTAIREASEEVGLPQGELDVLGTLSSLYVAPSNFDVLPVIARLNHTPELLIQPTEVREAFYIGLDKLMEKENNRLITVTTRSHSITDVPAYCVDDKIIWGATAMIISELLAVLPPLDKLML